MNMNTKAMAVCGVLLMMVLGACGGSETTVQVGVEPEGDRFEVRLLGQDSAKYEKLVLSLGTVEVSTGGKSVHFQPVHSARQMDLVENHAHLLGYMYLPHDADTADVTIRFDDTGAYQTPDSAGLVQTRTATIQFTSKRSDLEKRGRAVVQLHLKDSLFQARNAKALLPATFIAH
ncbi:hypothetical protein [Corallococcus sp. RDP092CA]|uniref:hypothetical protein n=1 Tax=Corallococcus sp. RDP092CA TaxID=3109369 RepID=UPI0035B40B41